MNIKFDSKSSPGSVVVYKDGYAQGIITKIKRDSERFKAGDRYFIPIATDFLVDKVFIKAPTYVEVKSQVLDLLNKLQPTPTK